MARAMPVIRQSKSADLWGKILPISEQWLILIRHLCSLARIIKFAYFEALT